MEDDDDDDVVHNYVTKQLSTIIFVRIHIFTKTST